MMPAMDADALLRTRASNAKLTDPEPDRDTLDLAFEAALRAPDHGLLHPYRFLLVRGAARSALGNLMAQHLADQNPEATAEELEKMRQKPMRAPLIIVVAAVVREHPKAQAVEQILCAGAAAQNILLALHARGYAGIWRTGGAAYAPSIKRAFGLRADDAIVGFIYAGTPAKAAPELRRAAARDHVQEWHRPLGD